MSQPAQTPLQIYVGSRRWGGGVSEAEAVESYLRDHPDGDRGELTAELGRQLAELEAGIASGALFSPLLPVPPLSGEELAETA